MRCSPVDTDYVLVEDEPDRARSYGVATIPAAT